MSIGLIIALASLLFAWSLLAGRIERLDVSGPIVFVVAGFLLCNEPLDLLQVSVETTSVHLLAEVTLVLLLFGDAARIDPRDLRRHSGLPIRLLAIGLPLTLAFGFGLAAAVFGGLSWQLAALLAAVLAPTDAALSAAVVSDPSLPEDIRRSLNVESGLNDGIATPVVTGLIASALTVLGVGMIADDASGSGVAGLVDLAGGLAIGAAVGYIGGSAVAAARSRGWMESGGRRVAVLMLPVLSFGLSDAVHVNYFVGAFVAGVAFRAAVGHDDDEATELPELLGQILALTVWFVFGASLLAMGLDLADWRVGLYAVLSLTVVRMVPVALSMIGSGASRATTVFVGWFGPRGLASVVFALLIVEELPPDDSGVRTVLATVVLTVLMSVVAHGISSRPMSSWMARQAAPPDSPGGRGIRPRRVRFDG